METKVHNAKQRKYLDEQIKNIEEYKSKKLTRDIYKKVNDTKTKVQPRT